MAIQFGAVVRNSSTPHHRPLKIQNDPCLIYSPLTIVHHSATIPRILFAE